MQNFAYAIAVLLKLSGFVLGSTGEFIKILLSRTLNFVFFPHALVRAPALVASVIS